MNGIICLVCSLKNNPTFGPVSPARLHETVPNVGWLVSGDAASSDLRGEGFIWHWLDVNNSLGGERGGLLTGTDGRGPGDGREHATRYHACEELLYLARFALRL
ncbi:hypothetical protein WMY93_020665 [Mugilogobius chulae]|uniref:Uncharacterized protein n=1 Tax=Mugilogobius chulae TaxID=88201 RepID=A0AAW0N9N1_9GOBI